MSYIEYILENGEPWLMYVTRIKVLNESKEDWKGLRQQVLSEPKIKSYLNEIEDFHSIPLKNHKNPELPIHKLLFLLEIGLDTDVLEIQKTVDTIMAHKDNNGVYQSRINIPKHFGGSGEDSFGWCLCDAPLLLYALLKAGINYENHVKQGVDYLISLYKNQGFPCSVSKELGKFRGPGRKDDCCPYATLIMLQLLSCIPEYRNSKITKEMIMVLLALWENSLEKHPYMFYMGNDFRKLKAPTIWYDIVSVADALSYFELARSDSRFLEMVKLIKDKQDEKGLFTPESIYQKFKNWDFGQKKQPSLYLSYLCNQILTRVGV